MKLLAAQEYYNGIRGSMPMHAPPPNPPLCLNLGIRFSYRSVIDLFPLVLSIISNRLDDAYTSQTRKLGILMIGSNKEKKRHFNN